MEKRQKRDKRELESLIPTIKSEEKRLDDLLSQTRAEAALILHDAEQQAAERIARAREQLPETLEHARKQRLAAIRREADDANGVAAEKLKDMERNATAKMAEAVDWIVSRVWPGDGE